MRMRLVAIVLCVGISVTVPLLSHHAFSSEFDANKPVKLKGTVSRIEWINPHTWIHVDVKETDGKSHEVDDRGRQPQCADPPRRDGAASEGRDGSYGRRVSGEGWIARARTGGILPWRMGGSFRLVRRGLGRRSSDLVIRSVGGWTGAFDMGHGTFDI